MLVRLLCPPARQHAHEGVPALEHECLDLQTTHRNDRLYQVLQVAAGVVNIRHMNPATLYGTVSHTQSALEMVDCGIQPRYEIYQ